MAVVPKPDEPQPTPRPTGDEALAPDETSPRSEPVPHPGSTSEDSRPEPSGTSGGAASAGTSTAGSTSAGHAHPAGAALAFAALGVVFGDIGTSPLYSLQRCSASTTTPSHRRGATSTA